MAFVLLHIDAGIAMLGTVEVIVLDVERKLGIVVPRSYLWPGSCRFVGPEVQEADLIPHETSNMYLYR
jgi:hypothetical protein